MHPALSVIFFTTASGAGYGLLGWLGLYALWHGLPDHPWLAIVAMALSLGLSTAGLLASTFHLGHPERAWRAFSQWRTSWLSREGVAAVVTFAPALALGAIWLLAPQRAVSLAITGLAATVCAVATVVCTAWIYRSLKPIPRWHNKYVVPNYLFFAAMSGALLLAALCDLAGAVLPGIHSFALISIVVALAAKLAYWRFIDNEAPTATSASATGLTQGRVRLFEAPHTSANYLMKEMGFRIARKHARKLRRIAIVLAFGIPLLLTLIALATGGLVMTISMAVGALSGFAGLFVERWLFFAEAKHTVTLYYGNETV